VHLDSRVGGTGEDCKGSGQPGEPSRYDEPSQGLTGSSGMGAAPGTRARRGRPSCGMTVRHSARPAPLFPFGLPVARKEINRARS